LKSQIIFINVIFVIIYINTCNLNINIKKYVNIIILIIKKTVEELKNNILEIKNQTINNNNCNNTINNSNNSNNTINNSNNSNNTINNKYEINFIINKPIQIKLKNILLFFNLMKIIICD